MRLLLLSLLMLQGCIDNQEKEISKVPQTKIKKFVYVNGINVSLYEARMASQLLSVHSNTEFDTFYNPTDSLMSDIFESARQGYAEKAAESLILNSLKETLQRLQLKHNLIYSKEDIKNFNDYFEKNKKFETLIVSHSQGNFFANQVCSTLPVTTKVIQVADPSPIKTNCEINHVNFDNDPVLILVNAFHFLPRPSKFHFKDGISISEHSMQTLRELLKNVNFEGFDTASLNDLFYNHHFDSYLSKEPTSRKTIIDSIQNFKNSTRLGGSNEQNNEQ